jgi:hypothetical protein
MLFQLIETCNKETQKYVFLKDAAYVGWHKSPYPLIIFADFMFSLQEVLQHFIFERRGVV